MKKMHKIVSVISAAAIAVSLIIPVKSFAETINSDRTVYISDTDEFLKFAEECRLDSASKDLKVELNADIDLSGNNFFGVPIFCGTFDGNGHTVSGLSIHDSASQTGLFRCAEKGSIIKDLKVKGNVSPSGSGNMVGGIVGVNKGIVSSCEFQGTVSGNDSVGGIVGKNDESGVINGCVSSAMISAESSVGGIAGMNLGVIMDCSNSGNINTVYADSQISADDLEIGDLTTENVIVKSDIGGIAGYSSGIIQRCANSGTIGYQHTGYNVGGIVGRQCGTLYSCTNTGDVYGRKDIGGIAGQMEPYRSIEFSEDNVQRLEDEMDMLSKYVDKLINDARNSGSKINDEIQKLTSQMNSAQKDAETITDRTEEIFNGYSDGINELLARADIALDGVPNALNSLDEAIQLIGNFSDKCEEALTDLKQAGEYSGDAIDNAENALKDIKSALSELEAGLRDIKSALLEIQSSLGDSEAIKVSLKNITSSLDKITNNMRDMSDAASRLNNAIKVLSEWLGNDDWKLLKNSVNAFSESLSDVLDALSDISGAVGDISASIDSSEMEQAFTKLNEASAALGRAAEKLSTSIGGGHTFNPDDLTAATDELKNAADALQKASEHLSSATDPESMQKALDELEAASRELQTALDNASAAAGDMSEALRAITGSTVPEDTLDTATKELDIIFSAISDMSDNLSDINAEVNVILDNIDAVGLSEAFGSLSDAADKIANTVNALNGASGNIDKASEALGNVLDSLTSAASKAGEAANIMSQVSDKLSESVQQFEDVVKTLSEKSEVRFPALDETFTSAADSLSDNMQKMISTLSRIGSIANSESNILLDDIQNISDCLERIFDIFKDTYKDLLSNDDENGISEDISEQDEASGNDSHGKAAGCMNGGKVEGDVNVGGITGAMAVEYDLDPEDDIAQSGDRSINFSYNVMDVIDDCENLGEIIAKKNYCGGIVGRMDMGLVKNSRASGSISSTSGSYVGGIAGYSSAKLRECLSKVTLSGSAYIGGIAGEGGIITNCLAISDITDFTEKIGALAGYVDFSKKNTEISDNFFVDRGVAGIDRVSYAGIAEPLDYAEFAKRAGAFADIVLEFTANGTSLGKITVPYGGSVNPSEIPEIPQIDGYFARWEEFDFDNITFPRVFEAEYIQLLSSIASDKQNKEGLPLLLADGSFDDKAKITVTTESSSIFPPEGGELRIVMAEGCTPNALRFLKSGNSSQLLQYVNGAWEPVQFTENGSYLIVNDLHFENGSEIFCISGNSDNTMLVVLLIVGGVIVAAAVIFIIVKANTRKKQPTK